MFSIVARGYCTGFRSVLVVYRLESVAHRYVLKGNKAAESIYRDCGTCRMVFHLQLMLQAFGVEQRPEINLVDVSL